ncbi:MAG: MerR family transcriptional regulator [Actinomycetota bacterium]|nr:MerR family transcriptional regulator [Actinomycetota bacterium]
MVDSRTDQAVDGYRAPQVCNLVGITYRQLDYWARTGLITPSLQQATGSGSQRLYAFPDIVQLKVVKRLLDAGMSLKKIRKAMEILRAELVSESPLSDVTLLSDGRTIYAAHSPSEVVDVFRGGQGVFGIAVGPVQEELVGEIHRLFPDRVVPVDREVKTSTATGH